MLLGFVYFLFGGAGGGRGKRRLRQENGIFYDSFGLKNPFSFLPEMSYAVVVGNLHTCY